MGLLTRQVLAKEQRALRAFIDLDPIAVMVHRIRRIRDEAGFEEQHELVGPFTCRLVAVPGQATGPRISDRTIAGSIYTDIFYQLLADSTADLQAGAHVHDEFTVDEGTFQINRVHYLRVSGQVYGYLCELEKVDS